MSETCDGVSDWQEMSSAVNMNDMVSSVPRDAKRDAGSTSDQTPLLGGSDTDSEGHDEGTEPAEPPRIGSDESSTFIYSLTFMAAIGGFLFGYDTGVVSGAMIIIRREFSLNSFWQELVVSVSSCD